MPDFSGKVRDLYDLGDKLLLVATDRLSAYDVIMPNGIPGRGVVLTEMSDFWFRKTSDIVPNHLITTNFEDFPSELRPYRDQLEGRTMLCKKADRVDIECVARGYLAGSGWREYQKSGTVCNIPLPKGLIESDRLPEPIFTPATKAEQGAHDENISFERMVEIVGIELAERLRKLTLRLYDEAATYALSRGIIIADTKFEFGFIDGELCVIDEMLSPDSSRFWDALEWNPGSPQESFDKQFVRDWLAHSGFTGDGEPPRLPEEVVAGTLHRYEEVRDRLLK
jgi:phosphoribosylaminoimidazole-succinocarboxamide synthase